MTGVETDPQTTARKLTIQSTSEAFWNLVKNEYRKTSVGVIVFCILTLFFTFLYNNLSIVLSFFILIVYVSILYSKARGRFMSHFANVHNLDYQPGGDIKSVTGRLFNLGDSQNISHVISGIYASWPIRIFYFQYSTGSGKHRTTHYFTILEISFSNIDFPFILLQSKNMWGYGTLNWGSSGDTKITLEPQHQDHFILYSTRGYETEALQIFTHATLNEIKKNTNNLSIEFSKNKIYVYDDKYISNGTELESLYSVAQKILDSSGAFISRLSDDFAVLHRHYKPSAR